ncbi:MAG TPA: phosphate signaling complex protein PhoU [Firmicutes bacterium]|jgi:phosphate transport system protein|nr:phosphate signaling complex protein PhoU [Bacillota bacterium]HOQ24880.1 phosphate signaling complex protein PhoU [Bacillota bacterium]HPT68261.1 phosphate signaling complex protein PhoU [Bacillota bacterium]
MSKAKAQLAMVQEDLLKMGKMVQDTVHRAIKALDEKNGQMALEIINQDDIIDNMLVVMEEEVATVLGEGPHPKDIKRLLSIAKIANNLERIADYASNIAEIVLEFKGQEYVKPLVHIPQMTRLALNMLDTALQAFVDGNGDLAEAVCKRDEEVDNLHDEVHRELLGLMVKETEGQRIRQSVGFMRISGFLERIADHATNIGEETIFISTGKRTQY